VILVIVCVGVHGIISAIHRSCPSHSLRLKLRGTYSRSPKTSALQLSLKVFQISLYVVVEADLELLCNR